MTANNRTLILLASLVGAFAVHFLLAACSGPSTTTPAMADGNTGGASPCSVWEVQQFVPPTFAAASVSDPLDNGRAITLPYAQDFQLPAGWEPIGGAELGAITARHCVQ